MNQKLTDLFQKEDCYFYQEGSVKLENRVDHVQLIASLTKPVMGYFYFHDVFKNKKANPETMLSELIETTWDVSLTTPWA